MSEHPADGLIHAIKGMFNGDNLEDSIRSAWDRWTGAPKPAPTPPQQSNWKPEPNVEQQQEINRSNARKKYPGMMSGK